MLNRWTMVAAAACLCVSGAMAQQATLKAGDKAPKLTVENWVKGKPFEKFETGKVYVVEFWATWCMPCIKGIPHLTELQKEYKNKNVTVIGVAASEKGGDSKSLLTGVENFVRKQGDKMEYTVAYDADKSMSKDWMAAAQQRGIPCAFVVGGDGKVAWIGHPMDGMDNQVKKSVTAAQKSGQGSSESSSSSDGKSSGDGKSSSKTDKNSDSKKSSDTKKQTETKKSTDPK